MKCIRSYSLIRLWTTGPVTSRTRSSGSLNRRQFPLVCRVWSQDVSYLPKHPRNNWSFKRFVAQSKNWLLDTETETIDLTKVTTIETIDLTETDSDNEDLGPFDQEQNDQNTDQNDQNPKKCPENGLLVRQPVLLWQGWVRCWDKPWGHP